MPERTEGSVMTSLGELRAIERARQAEESAAVQAAIDAKRSERERAEQAARDAEAAWQTAEREAKLQAELAREEAERKARLEIEAAEAAERARHQIALDARRIDEELAIQRELARRQRPRWMMAVTGVAITAALGLGWFAASAGNKADRAQEARAMALAAKANAQHDAETARQQAERLARDNQSLEDRLGSAIQRVEAAQAAGHERAEQERRRADQRRAFEQQQAEQLREQARLHQQRLQPIKISDDCLTNALCKK